MKSSWKYGLSRSGWEEQEGSGFNLFMENRECPLDNVNELRTGEIKAAPKGRSLPSTDWDQSAQDDGENTKPVQAQGSKRLHFNNLYSIMTTGQISSSHNSTHFSSDRARNVFCLLISGLREVKELHISNTILLRKKSPIIWLSQWPKVQKKSAI